MPARKNSNKTQQNSWVNPDTAEYIRRLSQVTGKSLGEVVDLLARFHSELTE